MPNSTDCPDCAGDPDEDDLHADDCPRVDSCGQIGPPYVPPPFHPWPADRSWLDDPEWFARHVKEMHSG